ncbi:hypothetical protein QC762_0041570 [Podospora pseudocomata]|uniref:LysM domain-containing protein n=1 Tax=Podospora pseudocomata TaxID=2093779 RepID=A0ABR0GMW9_9PEZI|nr:hypothetical protein QC762_0041570 [Podospora pseudocomata]
MAVFYLICLLLFQPAASQSLKSLAGYFSSLSLIKCPVRCDDSGPSQNWTRYHAVDQLTTCDKPPHLSFAFSSSSPNVDNQDNITIPFVVLSCSTNKGHLVLDEQSKVFDSLTKKGAKNSTANIEIFSESVSDLQIPGQKFAVIREIQASLLFNTSAATEHFDGSIKLVSIMETPYWLEEFIALVQDRDDKTLTGLQLCGANRTVQYTMGVFLDITADVALRLFRVQHALEAWSLSHCVVGLGQRESLKPSTFWLREPSRTALLNGTNSIGNWTTPVSPFNRAMAKTSSHVAECRTIQVASGDSCASLAHKCGLKNANDITKFKSTEALLCHTPSKSAHLLLGWYTARRSTKAYA